jgi:acyl-coenzyme A synthetase/AMP-(fatty) acid ligase
VLIMLPDGPGFAEAFAGIIKHGAVPLPVNPLLSAHDIVAAAAESGARLLLPMPDGSRAQQCLDGAAFVHGAVALGDLVEWQREIEDLAGVDLVVAHQVDQFGQEAAHRRGSAEQANVGVEQFLAAEVYPMRDPNESSWESSCSTASPISRDWRSPIFSA